MHRSNLCISCTPFSCDVIMASRIGSSSGQIGYCSTFFDIWIAPWWCGIISLIKFAFILLSKQALCIRKNIVCVIWRYRLSYRHRTCSEFENFEHCDKTFCISSILLVCSLTIFCAICCKGTKVVTRRRFSDISIAARWCGIICTIKLWDKLSESFALVIPSTISSSIL